MAEAQDRRGAHGRLDASGDRDVVFCHQCEHEWYQDEHGLTCPQCEGEATEIITADNDPRPSRPVPDPPEQDLLDLQEHNPWEHADPDEGDVEELLRHGQGFPIPNPPMFPRAMQPIPSAVSRSGRAPNPHEATNVINDFHQMMGNLMGPNFRQGAPGRTNQENLFRPGQPDTPGFLGMQAQVHTFGASRSNDGQWVFTSGSGPRNAGGPQPRGPPVEDIATLLGNLFGAMGPMAGAHGPNDQGQGQPGMGMGLQGLFASLLNPANAVAGDAVYSQEALDRIISNLMEQHPTSNAPGPASESAIQNLPKKLVDEKMLGPEMKAECSVCMDDVELGTEVVLLPCTHWFHETCARAWLTEHNTCPICRKGISESGSSSQTDPNRASPNQGSGNSGNIYGQGPTPQPQHQRRNSANPPFSTSTRNEARLSSIRNTAGRLDPTPAEADHDRFRVQAIGDPSRTSPIAPPSVPGAWNERTSSFSRRMSGNSDEHRDIRRRTSASNSASGSGSSARSTGSANNGSSGGGPISWLRRNFSGNGGSGR